MTEQMINFTIDGKPLNVPAGTTVYKAATEMGIDIPIFCYQDRMPPFGACRVCLVEVDNMPKLQTSCTLEARDGMVVKTQSQMAVEGRKGILEFLLINHPLDCPICDRGGECPLQDQALKFGPGESRFFEEKRHFYKPKPMGPVLMLDRERCIVCARCTRFSDLVSGDHALQLLERGFKSEVGTPGDAPIKSKFIGNTIEICPVGALTSQVYRFRARPWDNQPTPSTCTLCPVGCSMILDARDGEIMRTRSCENKAVNDMWMCDKGWFGYEFTDHPDRLKRPLIRRNDRLEPATWDEALQLIATKLSQAQPGGKLAGFGGNPLTTEENFLFQKLFRQELDVHHLDHRIGMPFMDEQEEGIQAGMQISIGECEDLSHVLLLGIDLTEEFPVIWLRLKQALNKGARVEFIGNFAPEIASQLSNTVVHAPGKELELLPQNLSFAVEQAKNGKKTAIFIGRQYLESANRLPILSELLKYQASAPEMSLNILEGRGNSIGARIAGMRPDLGPLGEKIEHPGLNALQVLTTAIRAGWDYLHVAGADPALKFPKEFWQQARAKLGFLVVQDLFLTETAKQADVVLPTLCFVEKEGSFINIEGRVQKLHAGKDLPYGVYSDGEIFTLLGLRLNSMITLDTKFAAALQTEGRLQLNRPTTIAKSTQPQDVQSTTSFKAVFAPALFDHGVRMMHNPHVIQLSEAPRVRIHPKEADKFKLKDEDRVSIKTQGNSLQASIKLDPRVADKTIVLPVGYPELPIHELGLKLMNGMGLELERV